MSKTKNIVFLCLMLYAYTLNAQWRVGVTAGADYNHYSRDNHYMEDWHYTGAWGASVGIMGQYDFTKWMGLRADFNWTQKNHQEYRTSIPTNYKIQDSYFQLPLMVSCHYRWKRIKGFIHLGGYGGYLSWRFLEGVVCALSGGLDYPHEKINKNKEIDHCFDYGWIYGCGIEYQLTNHWALQAEARCYHSMQSITKDYMKHMRDPRYNTTYVFQMALCYDF